MNYLDRQEVEDSAQQYKPHERMDSGVMFQTNCLI